MTNKSKAIQNVSKDITNNFDDWVKDLEEGEQPTCNIDNPEECDSCGA